MWPLEAPILSPCSVRKSVTFDTEGGIFRYYIACDGFTNCRRNWHLSNWNGFVPQLIHLWIKANSAQETPNGCVAAQFSSVGTSLSACNYWQDFLSDFFASYYSLQQWLCTDVRRLIRKLKWPTSPVNTVPWLIGPKHSKLTDWKHCSKSKETFPTIHRRKPQTHFRFKKRAVSHGKVQLQNKKADEYQSKNNSHHDFQIAAQKK